MNSYVQLTIGNGSVRFRFRFLLTVRFEKKIVVRFNGFVVQFGLVQVSKVVNGSVSNRFGLDPLKLNQTEPLPIVMCSILTIPLIRNIGRLQRVEITAVANAYAK